MDRTLAKNILATITYYDVMDRALTVYEIWRWLLRSPTDRRTDVWTLADVMRTVEDPTVREYITERNGLYMLCGREALVELRRQRERISVKKMRRLRRIVCVVQWSPFVRMIAVTGRLAFQHADENSDLDVLIAYEAGHIWTGRFFVTVVAHLLGIRRYGTHTRDRLCLNYHIATNALDVPTQDAFSAHEYSVAIPLAGKSVFDAFNRANMLWAQHYKPHYMATHFANDDTVHCVRQWGRRIGRCVQAFLEWVCGDAGTERRLRRLQRQRALRDASVPGAIILATDHHLVFLPKPHGPEVYEEYRKRFDALELKI